MKWKAWAKRALAFAIDQWFLIGIGFVILFSYLGPQLMMTGGWIRAEWTVNFGVIAIIFLLSGLSMPTPALLLHAANFRLHIVVQAMCFLVTPTVFFAIVQGALRAGNGAIDFYALMGLVVTGCTSTTIASSVIMTRKSGGDDAAALVEVTIGNFGGVFITPALLQLFTLPATGLQEGRPSGNVSDVYARVMLHLGCAVLAPLAVGQVVRYLFSGPVARILEKYRLNKLGSVGLLLLIWTTFSSAFGENAFAQLSAATIIMIVFVSAGLYVAFTLLALLIARPFFSREILIAIAFCSPAKSQAVGFPLIQALYPDITALQRAIITVPLVLYQTEQLVLAQLVVSYFRWRLQKHKRKGEVVDSEDASTELRDSRSLERIGSRNATEEGT